MRFLAVFVAAVSFASLVEAQEQERKLVDRLLSPDTELANPAQNKKFSADRKSTDKPANVGTFYFKQNTRPTNFSGTRDFPAGQFHSPRRTTLARSANTSSGIEIQNARRTIEQPAARGVRETREAGKSVAVQNYGRERPFLERGKSQKSLDRHNEPMTIDEVRELLNKNK